MKSSSPLVLAEQYEIHPVEDRVAILPIEEGDMKGSLYIPDAHKARPVRGTIIAVGEGLDNGDAIIPLRLKVGDIVIFGKYDGVEVEINGRDVVLMRESSVIAKLVDKD